MKWQLTITVIPVQKCMCLPSTTNSSFMKIAQLKKTQINWILEILVIANGTLCGWQSKAEVYAQFGGDNNFRIPIIQKYQNVHSYCRRGSIIISEKVFHFDFYCKKYLIYTKCQRTFLLSLLMTLSYIVMWFIASALLFLSNHTFWNVKANVVSP